MQASTHCDGSSPDESLINKSIDEIMQPRVIDNSNDYKIQSELLEDMYILDLGSNRTLLLEEIELLNEILTPRSPKLPQA